MNEAIAGAVARGWCHPANEHKVMDEELAVAIVQEVEAILPIRKAQLGYATTLELIRELEARADVAATVGEDWPNYRTVQETA